MVSGDRFAITCISTYFLCTYAKGLEKKIPPNQVQFFQKADQKKLRDKGKGIRYFYHSLFSEYFKINTI